MRIAQRPELTARDSFGQREGVAAEHDDVLEAEWRQSGDVLGADVEAFGAELIERGIHVNCIPEHDYVDDEAERAELVLLAFAVALAQFAALAVEDDARELVTALAAVELDETMIAIFVSFAWSWQGRLRHSEAVHPNTSLGEPLDCRTDVSSLRPRRSGFVTARTHPAQH